MFGDINDPESEVSRLKKSQRNYDLLGELNVRPRTSYLARITNPNPQISPKTNAGPHGHGETGKMEAVEPGGESRVVRAE